jgi:translation initiation factor IF-1
MVSISKFIGLLSCSFLLSVILSNVASSADEPTTHTSAKMVSDSIGKSKLGHTIKGEVVRVEGDNYFFVKEEDGNVVGMHVDATTEKRSALKANPGDHVMAKVDAQGHAISFLTDQPIAH